MKTTLTLATLLITITQGTQAQNSQSQVDSRQQARKTDRTSRVEAGKAKSSGSNRKWNAAFEQLLKKDPDVRRKIENGDTTKAEVIAWMKGQTGEKKESSNEKKADQDLQLDEFKTRLRQLVADGRLTRRQAAELYETMAGTRSFDDGTSKSAASKIDWNLEYEKLLRANPAVKAKVDNGGATKEQVIAWLKAKRGGLRQKGKDGAKQDAKPPVNKKDGIVGFYAVVIGRLKTKDIELGEFTFDVDHVTSMYGNHWVKDKLVGRTVKLTGVSGQFLDSLLQIKRGETLKVRTGRYIPDANTLTFGTKFHVLERSAPFKPEDFGIPPEAFRGFRGELTGTILDAKGYEVLLQVSDVRPTDDSKAGRADSIRGGRIRIVGFYNRHRELFADLHKGDIIRVSTSHNNPEHDELNVTSLLRKIEK